MRRDPQTVSEQSDSPFKGRPAQIHRRRLARLVRRILRCAPTSEHAAEKVGAISCGFGAWPGTR
jgi:hypothetical protein